MKEPGVTGLVAPGGCSAEVCIRPHTGQSQRTSSPVTEATVTALPCTPCPLSLHLIYTQFWCRT